jgi:hypothetical protein
VGKKMAFKLAELDLSPKTVEVTFEAAVPDLRTSMPDYVDSLSLLSFLIGPRLLGLCSFSVPRFSDASMSFLRAHRSVGQQVGVPLGLCGFPTNAWSLHV